MLQANLVRLWRKNNILVSAALKFKIDTAHSNRGRTHLPWNPHTKDNLIVTGEVFRAMG